ncbi:MAG TPA: type III-A CRISPR-associated protein Cas10/Csm1 [Syntrophorhabdaceae bacterium]|nr:type III-A CRISPR-associated protein Cas10/Csm1 [Syntrophorhabdaceae bacterium]
MSFNEQEFETVVLGALLHDIGKVVQRANNNPTSKKHTEWGYEWLETHFQKHPAKLAAIAHHYTKDDDYALNNNLGLIWYQSDNLASKERKDKEKLEEGKWHSEIAMASPFSRVNNPLDTNKKPLITYLPLKSDGIPFTLTEEPSCSRKDYEQILSEFEEDLNSHIPENKSSINFLLMLIEKHLKNIPSITMRIYDGLKKEEIKDKHPDLSLFDHLKLTAAIAGCMYHYYSKEFSAKWIKNELLKDEILNVPKDKRPYLLIGGDISGIQKFIYTITSKGALKSLKGRSFYVEFLIEHIVSEIIERLKLTRCNIIFSGGGSFYILSYNTAEAKVTIENVKKEINDLLFKQFSGSLFLNLETVEFHPDAFQNSQDLWPELSKKLEESKKKKWNERLEDIITSSMPHNDCLTRYCEVCFREDLPLEPVFSGSEQIYEHVCRPCSIQYELGNALKEASKSKDYVIYSFDEKDYNEVSEKTLIIGNSYYVLSKRNPDMDRLAKKVYIINSLDVEKYYHPSSIFLPIGIYQHRDLKELSDASDVFGINRLAVLRMDVDSLGKIFSQAVPLEHRTFSRMASISRALNDFFKFYLNMIVSSNYKNSVVVHANIADRATYNDRMLSIVYSGGDDLFIVGHWLDVMEAGIDIRNYFEKYTGNPFITISGGISINHNKYPIYLYAREADNAEKEAKNFKEENETKARKNAITFFKGKPLRWPDVERLKERVFIFEKFLIQGEKYFRIDEKKLPKTFFYRLLALARRFNEDGVLVLPKAAYLLSRARIGTHEPEIKMQFNDAIMNSNEKEWKITELATLIILMLMRKGGKEDER